MTITNGISKLVLLSIFAIVLTLYSTITLAQLQGHFMQNDDWVYYLNIQNFLAGNFSLHELTAPTFYTQGFIGFVFAKLFGLESLPILTIVASLLCLFFFYKLLAKIDGISKSNALLATLLFAVNPIFIYSSIGFMTENYGLLFIIIALYFFIAAKPTTKTFAIGGIFYFLAFYARQAAIFIPIGLILHKTGNTIVDGAKQFNIKNFALRISAPIALLVLTLIAYFATGTQTSEMDFKADNILSLNNLTAPNHFENLVFAIFFVSLFSAPALILFQYKRLVESKLKDRLVFVVGYIILATSLLTFMNSYSYLGEAITFFGNTFTEKGFFPGEISGNKYIFRSFYNLFKIMGIISILTAPLLILIPIQKFKSTLKTKSFYLILVYVGMVMAAGVYDRYLLPAFPLVLIFLAELNGFSDFKKYRWFNSIFSQLIFAAFITVFAALSYLFASDFIKAASYIWDESNKLVEIESIERNQIEATRDWNLYYETIETPMYRFSYDGPEQLEDDRYELIKTHQIDFIGNLFIEPNIYLYNLRQNIERPN